MIAAWRPGGSSGRAGPPDAGALNAPPPARKRTRVPSGDQRGCDWTTAVSSVSGMLLPPDTVRTKMRMSSVVPLEYATLRPSGEIAGRISIPGSHVTLTDCPKVSGGAARPPIRPPSQYAPATSPTTARNSAMGQGRAPRAIGASLFR
jgi:hypothetical protein